jgi:hypothetical protein
MQTEKKLDDFLREESNFKTMVKIVEAFKVLKPRLLEEFWQLFIDKLKAALSDEYVIEKDDNISRTWSKIYVYKKNWLSADDDYISCTSMQSLTGKVMFGIYTNANSKAYDYSPVREKVKANENLKGLKNDKWWAAYKYVELDFSRDKDLEMIIPSNRESLASNWALQLADFTRAVSLDLDIAIEEIKTTIK